MFGPSSCKRLIVLSAMLLMAWGQPARSQDLAEEQNLTEENVGYELTDVDAIDSQPDDYDSGSYEDYYGSYEEYDSEPMGYGEIDFDSAPFIYETEFGNFIHDNPDSFYISASSGFSQGSAGVLDEVAKTSINAGFRVFRSTMKGVVAGLPVHFGFAGSYEYSNWKVNDKVDLFQRFTSFSAARSYRLTDLEMNLFGLGPEWHIFLPTRPSGTRTMIGYSIEGVTGVGNPDAVELAGVDATRRQFATSLFEDPGTADKIYGYRMGATIAFVHPSGASLSGTFNYSFLRSRIVFGAYRTSEVMSGMFSLGIPTDVLGDYVANLFE